MVGGAGTGPPAQEEGRRLPPGKRSYSLPTTPMATPAAPATSRAESTTRFITPSISRSPPATNPCAARKAVRKRLSISLSCTANALARNCWKDSRSTPERALMFDLLPVRCSNRKQARVFDSENRKEVISSFYDFHSLGSAPWCLEKGGLSVRPRNAPARGRGL